MGERTVADRYRLEEHLGSGGMGEVWRATDLELHETVALKRTDDAAREARIGTELSHPNVITVHGTVVDGAEQWLVMEYLPSRTLAEIIETDGPISPERAAKIGAQLADALTAMHTKGMVHRDVKPGNVLVAENDVAKLSDFGISRWSEGTRVGGGDVAGTPAYLAPEVADGHEARPASDVFALGATLFAAVEGTSPWGSPDAGAQEQLRRAKAYDITPARNSGPFGDVLAQLMRRDPQDRPATENVRPLLEGVRLPKPWRRKATVVGAATLVAVLVTGAVIYANLPAAGTVGDPATMDVCGLAAGKDDYQRFNARDAGTGAEKSYWFNGCATWVSFDEKGDDGVVVEYSVKQFAPYGAAKPTGALGQIEQGTSTKDICTKTIRMVDGNLLQIDVKTGGTSDRPLCEIADVAGAHARTVLSEGQIPRRSQPWPQDSLGALNACGLLGKDEIRAQLEAEATPYPWNELGNWGCGWDYRRRTASIEFSRQGPFEPDDGTRVDVGRGLGAVYEPEDGACEVSILHKAVQEERFEVVVVILADENAKDSAALCPGAIFLAKAVVAKLP
ncbi:serine/threonine protein kinase [Lentzea sp. NBC_00516]|uniref:serine/threonine-protein kinase n=1 Tax=Lentzea sp. NBC_00516 TaxID=2903582 RepID=UPI002E81A5FB|nr:serine/threonine-protein kinase [Lentzea sp. NBC_00516]WUD25797.1 serine/threonine protein kinase [Lentzea sp. NBC_00516]